MKEKLLELLCILQRMDIRIQALEMDSEGRGADSQDDEIEQLRKAISEPLYEDCYSTEARDDS